MENIFEKELKKHEDRNKEVCEMLDNYEKNGVNNDETVFFNLLCKEEVELRFKIESLSALVSGESAQLNLSPIVRSMKMIISQPTEVIHDASIIKNIKE